MPNLITIRTVTMRVNADGKVQYARSNRSGKFFSHKAAQSMYNADQARLRELEWRKSVREAAEISIAKREAKANRVAERNERLNALVIVVLAFVANIVGFGTAFGAW